MAGSDGIFIFRICVLVGVENSLRNYLFASDNGAFKTVESVWEDRLPNAILVSHWYASQLKMSTRGNQVCLAHLLRDVIALD